jgi:hypothetical protein
MGFLSVALNIFTLLVVAAVFYIAKNLYRTRPDRRATPGDMFNDMIGGRKADVPASVIMGNTPEARRARMMARLRRKVAEKNLQ